MVDNLSPTGTYGNNTIAGMDNDERAQVRANLNELKSQISGSAAEGGMVDANTIAEPARQLIFAEIDELIRIYA